MMNTLSSEDLWFVGASVAVATGVAFAVTACGRYAMRPRLNPLISEVASKQLGMPNSAPLTYVPMEKRLEIISQEMEERNLIGFEYEPDQNLGLQPAMSKKKWEKFSESEVGERSHEGKSNTVRPFSSVSSSLLPKLEFSHTPRRILSIPKSSLPPHLYPVSYKSAILPPRLTLNEAERSCLFESELQKSKAAKLKPLVQEIKTITLPSGTEVRMPEILNKKDSFFLSYATCLWKEISKSKDSSFLYSAIVNDPMFLSTWQEMTHLENFMTSLSRFPNFQSNSMMNNWVLFLRSLTGSALEDAPDRIAIYETVVKELQSMDECRDLHPSFNDEDFEVLVRNVRYGDVPATLTMIQALSAKLGKSVSVLQDDPNFGLSVLSWPSDLPVIGKVLLFDHGYSPLDFPIFVEPRESGYFIQTTRSNMTFFSGYAVAILHACIGNLGLVSDLKKNSVLDEKSLEILEDVAGMKSLQDLHQSLANPLLLQTLVKGLKALWESCAERRSLENMDSASLDRFMEKTKIPIRIKQSESVLCNSIKAYGNLVLEKPGTASYTPLEVR